MQVLKTGLMAAVMLTLTAPLNAASLDDQIEQSRVQLRADRKEVIRVNIPMTDTESKAFWTVYDSYEEDRRKIEDRSLKLIKDYADAYNNDAVNDSNAKAMIKEYLAVEKARLDMRESYVNKFGKAIPMPKVMRFYQIENRLQALFDLGAAEQIPLVE
jgi:hypothetical protein